MIQLNELASSGSYLSIFKDSEDPKKFYYIPQFAAVAVKENGRLVFGQMLFKFDPSDPNDGYSDYRFTVRAVEPVAELQKAIQNLEAIYGRGVRIMPIPAQDITVEIVHVPLSFLLITKSCQRLGQSLFSDLGVGFTFPEKVEPAMSNCFKGPTGAVGFLGAINYKLQGIITPFKASIKANWYRVHEHFKAQASVNWWFISSNISYETQKLIENGTIEIKILGGSPQQKEQVYSMAKLIVERLFVPAIQPNPLPGHPTGGIVCLSINYSRVEENRTVTWTIEEQEYETRNMGMAVIVGDIPPDYFSSVKDKPTKLSLDRPYFEQASEEIHKQINKKS